MVEVICDTNFLIHLATRRILNLDRIELEIGQLKFLVPIVVEFELNKLKNVPSKELDIKKTLEFIKKFKKIQIFGTFADDEIVKYIKLKKSFIGTMDKKLKKLIKNHGGLVISFNNDKLVLET